MNLLRRCAVTICYGCGTFGRMGEARRVCDEAEQASEGYPLDPNEWDSIVIIFESLRDAGVSKADARNVASLCDPGSSHDACRVCVVKVIDAVWP